LILYGSTGATGFIGGSVLNKIIEKHPELEVTALLRSPTKAFAEKYPTVTVVKGDFDAFDVIERGALNANIVIRKSVCAIVSARNRSADHEKTPAISIMPDAPKPYYPACPREPKNPS
jgi:nucleoside-diphosphate-sugar epimerase